MIRFPVPSALLGPACNLTGGPFFLGPRLTAMGIFTLCVVGGRPGRVLTGCASRAAGISTAHGICYEFLCHVACKDFAAPNSVIGIRMPSSHEEWKDE